MLFHANLDYLAFYSKLVTTVMTGLVIVLKCYAFLCNFGLFGLLLETCYNHYDWISWSYLNVMLFYAISDYLAFYSKLVTTVTTGLVGYT